MKVQLNEIMNYMLFSCFLLLMVNLSVAADFQVQQKPRFYGVKVGTQVLFKCSASDPTLGEAVMTWHKIEKYEEDKVYNGQMHQIENDRASKLSGQMRGHLRIINVQVKDSGIYYCKMNQTWGPGTQLQVFRYHKREVVEWRNDMKDIIILLQGFLLMACIIIPLIWYYRLQKEEAVYEEPEHDHTYEGLEIGHSADLYEDLTAFVQNPDTDASWEIESPEQE
ncbi:B-cell antigen receptor complex-associated protein beta chain isoform X2 [Neoarius graeffei]|uniref:B-cell antigen receptor complex-associated protein beta chain isoform X2 n=1 Tax=Neoarius graeffei TaxID=443677 RepID=UPI00298D3084|nr:B-cell antigen receptor complex-associated protein beta chain isoform X2 [Neoarius graeffei]